MADRIIGDPCSQCLLFKSNGCVEPPRDAGSARFLTVAKPPTVQQAREGKPLSGSSLKLFAKYAKQLGFFKDDFVFTNSVRCGYDPTTFSSKDRKVIEAACREHLNRLIEQMRPECIITLGAEAAKAVHGHGIKITKVRGVPEHSPQHDSYIVATTDPGYVYINPQHEPLFASDLAVVKRLVDYDYDLVSVQRDTVGDYRSIDDLQFLVDQQPEILSFDTETTGLKWQEPGFDILTMQFCTELGVGYLLPWSHPGHRQSTRAKQRLKRQLKQLLQNPHTSVLGQHCLEGDVEFLSPMGWIRLDEYSGQEVMQWDPITSSLSFTEPNEYIEQEYEGPLLSWSGEVLSTGWMTPNHGLYLSTPAHRERFKRFAADSITGYNNRYVPLGGIYQPEASTVLDISADEARLLEMVRADGFISPNHDSVRIKVAKARKICRVVQVLNRCGIQYSVSEFAEYTDFTMHGCALVRKVKRLLGSGKNKKYGCWVMNLSVIARLAILDEARYWDGNERGTAYGSYAWSTAHDETAIWFQIIAHITGYRYGNGVQHNGVNQYGEKLYLNRGTVSDRNRAKLQRPPKVKQFKGKIYCFSVDSGAFLIRHNGKISVTGNSQFDALAVLQVCGFRYRIDHDTLMLAAELDENAQSKSLDDLTKRYYPVKSGYADAFNAKYDKSRMDLVPLDELVPYGCGDVDATLGVFYNLVEQAAADEKMWAHYRRVAIPAINAFVSMERRGILISEENLDAFERVLAEHVEESRKALLSQVPRSIKRAHLEKGLKFSRPEFLIDILFRHPDGFRLRPKVFTKSTEKLADNFKVPSVSTKDHLPFFFDHPRAGEFCIALAEYIKNERMLGTNVRGFRDKYITNGKVHSQFALWHAVTGRTSSKNPNAANFPARGPQAKAYRKMFVAPPGYVLISCDLSQAELRVAADLANDRVMLRIYADEGDIHITTACMALGITLEQFYRLPKKEQKDARQKAKSINFGYCIAEGELVLTDQGLVPIEQVTTRHLVWDGVEWVNHDGVIFMGEKEVITYDSLTATPDHKVYVYGQPDPVSIGYLASEVCSRQIAVGAVGETTVRYENFNWSDRTAGTQPPLCGTPVPFLQPGAMGFGGHPEIGEIVELQMPSSGEVQSRSSCSNAWAAVRRYGATLRKMDAQGIQALQRAWHKGTLFVKRALRKVGFSEVARFDVQWSGLRSDRQRRGLQPRELEACVSRREHEKQRTCRVYDILNAGPRHRFTVSGKVVSNCYGMWWKKFKIYAKTNYGVDFTDAEAKRVREGFFDLYSGLETWHDAMKAFAAENGYVRSYSGRVRHLPTIWSPEDYIRQEAGRQAINSVVQNFASDLGVMALSRIDQELDSQYFAVCNFVHDAIYAYVPEQYVEWGARTMKYYMESNPIEEWFGIKLKVPIVADPSFGWNGGEMYEMGKLPADEPYDFEELAWDAESKKMRFFLPEQEIPPNNGRIVQPEHMKIYL